CWCMFVLLFAYRCVWMVEQLRVGEHDGGEGTSGAVCRIVGIREADTSHRYHRMKKRVAMVAERHGEARKKIAPTQMVALYISSAPAYHASLNLRLGRSHTAPAH